MQAKSTFIVIEGVDGAGKTTQVKLLREYFESQGKTVLTFREPGGTMIGERIREILLDRKLVKMSAVTELFLYVAARTQLVAEQLRPARKETDSVLICDRFTLSTLVYQSYAGEIHPKELLPILNFKIGDCVPDLCFILDLPVEESIKRIHARHSTLDRMEQKMINRLSELRKGYKLLSSLDLGYPCKTIDASKDSAEVHLEIRDVIKNPHNHKDDSGKRLSNFR